MALHVLVLGSAAGGGFPQWNCGCQNCIAVRTGKAGFHARAQDSVAVSADGEHWFLLNASPDVLLQVGRSPELWPKRLRHSPISGVVLTNGDLDHVLGLLQLRESQPLSLYSTLRVEEGLRLNPMLRTLERFEGHVRFHRLELGKTHALTLADGKPSGLSIEALPVPGKPPLHLMGSHAPSPEDNIALKVRGHDSASLVYATAIADAKAAASVFEGCAALLLDGTFWSENELPELGVQMGPAKSMAHQPISGALGSLEALSGLNVPRRIYTHLNNTNPILNENSAERLELNARGWEVAVDGMKFRIE